MLYCLKKLCQHLDSEHTLLPVFENLICHSRAHNLTDNPKIADIILVVDGHQAQLMDIDKGYADLGISNYIDKTVLYDQSDRPRVRTNVIGPCFNRLSAQYSQVHSFSLSPCIYVTWPGDGIVTSVDSDVKRYTWNYIGSNTHPIRQLIVSHFSNDTSGLVIDTTVASNALDKPTYMSILKNSVGTLCPRGHGYATWRMYEALSVGSAPLIISDFMAVPEGLPLDTMSIKIRESDVLKARGKRILGLIGMELMQLTGSMPTTQTLLTENRFELINAAVERCLIGDKSAKMARNTMRFDRIMRMYDSIKNSIYRTHV